MEVTADNGIEWQKDKNYVARGNALVKRGDLHPRRHADCALS